VTRQRMVWRRYSRRVIPAQPRRQGTAHRVQLQISQYEALILPHTVVIPNGDTIRIPLEATVRGPDPKDWRHISLPVTITATIA